MHQEKILASAIKYPWGEVVTGFRHSDVIKAMAAKRLVSHDGIQGFVTSMGRFVDREEAANIAYEADQIFEVKHELYSEDVWPDSPDAETE